MRMLDLQLRNTFLDKVDMECSGFCLLGVMWWICHTVWSGNVLKIVYLLYQFLTLSGDICCSMPIEASLCCFEL